MPTPMAVQGLQLPVVDPPQLDPVNVGSDGSVPGHAGPPGTAESQKAEKTPGDTVFPVHPQRGSGPHPCKAGVKVSSG